MATPHVSGAIAAVWSRSDLNGQQVVQRLMQNGTIEMIGSIPVGQNARNVVIYVFP